MPPSSHSGSSRKSSPTQPRRPRSPVSMYVSDFGFVPPKQPKPLPKVERKNKGKAKESTSTVASTSTYSPSQSISSRSVLTSSSNASFGSANSSTKTKQSSISFAPILKSLRRKSSAKPTSSAPPPLVPPKDTPLTPPPQAEPKVDQPCKTFGEKSSSQSAGSGFGPSPDSDAVRDSIDSYVDSIKFARRSSLTSSAYGPSSHSAVEYKPPAPTSPPPWLTLNTAVPPPRPPRRRPKTAPSPQIQTHDLPRSRSVVLGAVPSSPSSSLSPPSSTTDSDEVEPKTPTLTRSKSIATHARKDSEPRPETPFVDSSIPMQAYLSATWSSRHDPNVMRKERSQGWSGEWNRDNMQDVIEKLRTLK